jgi:hypothetical protein
MVYDEVEQDNELEQQDEQLERYGKKCRIPGCKHTLTHPREMACGYCGLHM